MVNTQINNDPKKFLLNHLPAQYSTVYATQFSPDGDYLAAANDSGKIALWKLDSILTRGSEESNKVNKMHPSLICRAFDSSPIFSLVSTDRFLIAGSVGEIKAYAWKDLLREGRNKKSVTEAWSITLYPIPGSPISSTEINWMELYKDSDITSGYWLVVAGGDSVIHVYDLETREEVHSLKGHSNYIHSVSVCPSTGKIASASEDGSVRLWDIKKKRAQIAKIIPSERSHLNRPKLGKWVGAVALSNDWLVCGGGPSAGLWHLKSMAPSFDDPLPPLESSVTFTSLLPDRIVIGGGSGHTMYHTDYNGHTLAQVKTSSSCIYSVSHQDNRVKVLACSGSSSQIDLCTPNFSYKDQTITFPPLIK